MANHHRITIWENYLVLFPFASKQQIQVKAFFPLHFSISLLGSEGRVAVISFFFLNFHMEILCFFQFCAPNKNTLKKKVLPTIKLPSQLGSLYLIMRSSWTRDRTFIYTLDVLKCQLKCLTVFFSVKTIVLVRVFSSTITRGVFVQWSLTSRDTDTDTSSRAPE